MPLKVKDILALMNKIAPFELAYSYDNPGLLIGDANAGVDSVMCALDPTPEVAEQAAKKNCQLLITHHPIFMQPVKSIVAGELDTDTVITLIKNGVSLICAHTNLDIAPGGVNDALAQKLGLMDTVPLENIGGELYKLVVYVPEDHAEPLRHAVCNAGAGHIGNYSECTFSSKGYGTFLPGSDTNPYTGTPSVPQRTPEMRMETVVPSHLLPDVLSAMRAVHPYEEIAYDVLCMKNTNSFGIGRVGDLPLMMPFDAFCRLVKEKLGCSVINASGDPKREIRRVAVCGGSGGDLTHAALKNNADAYVFGEAKYHQLVEAKHLGLCTVMAGHYHTEAVILPELINRLQRESDALQYNVRFIPAVGCTGPSDVSLEGRNEPTG